MLCLFTLIQSRLRPRLLKVKFLRRVAGHVLEVWRAVSKDSHESSLTRRRAAEHGVHLSVTAWTTANGTQLVNDTLLLITSCLTGNGEPWLLTTWSNIPHLILRAASELGNREINERKHDVVKAKQIEGRERWAAGVEAVGTVLIKWSPLVTVVKTRQFLAVTPRYEANSEWKQQSHWTNRTERNSAMKSYDKLWAWMREYCCFLYRRLCYYSETPLESKVAKLKMISLSRLVSFSATEKWLVVELTSDSTSSYSAWQHRRAPAPLQGDYVTN